ARSSQQDDSARQIGDRRTENLLNLPNDTIDIGDQKAGIEQPASQRRIGHDDPSRAIAVDLLDRLRQRRAVEHQHPRLPRRHRGRIDRGHRPEVSRGIDDLLLRAQPNRARRRCDLHFTGNAGGGDRTSNKMDIEGRSLRHRARIPGEHFDAMRAESRDRGLAGQEFDT
ncbi:hypothetical protein chiPu_0033924, partial [Chiloscyllium punctatum]|nr:hypothetical protein [Chiloscyllium punctatum]